MTRMTDPKGSAMRNTIGRRSFIVGAAALGGSGLLSGIAGQAARAQTRGGRLRIAWNAASARDTLAPTRLTSTLDWARGFQIMSPLVRFTPDMKPTGDLAESWEPVAGGKEWIFNLRRGVTFHNGKELTAQDVVYSMNLHRGEDSDSPIKTWFSQVTDVTALDKHQVKFSLEAPNADMPQLLAWPNTVVVPDGFTNFANPVGTGPFRLSLLEPGVRMVAARNDSYHFEGRPYVDEVETFGISDTQARTNALLAGDVHYFLRADPKTVSLLERSPGVEVVNAAGGRHISMPMMADRAPTNDPNLRKALRLMADRKAMLDNVLKGYGALGNDTPVPASNPFHAEFLPQREMDLDLAKFHLRKAGMENASLELHTSTAAGGPSGPDIALLFRETAAKAGLDLQVVRQPSDGYWSAVWMKHAFHMSNWMPRPTIDLILTQLYQSEASWNEGQFKNERFDQVIKEARSELDFNRRKELYGEAQKLLYDEGASIIPLFTNWLDAKSEKLKGYTAHPFGEADGYRLSEHVWLED